ncbi:MAG: Ig-like domain-containing protein [Candidatus Dojkabacteria bacterium]
MAKNKNSKIAAPKKTAKQESMKSKVEIKQPVRNRQERMSRLVGSIFIGLGVLLVAFGIYSFIRFREEPVLNIELEAPVLSEVTQITNEKEITVRGLASGYDDVYIYVNDVKIGSSKVNSESEFLYRYSVESEGEFAVNVAGVKGFPNRVIGPRSEIKVAKVDWSAPSQDSISFKYGEETNKDTFIIAGNAEALSSVIVKRGTLSYDTIADADGKFRIEGIDLEEGKNVFTLTVRDQAGNETVLDEKVRVTYSPLGSVNGDAVVDENIPQASGELDVLLGNSLMMVFAIVALLAFATSFLSLSYHKRR